MDTRTCVIDGVGSEESTLHYDGFLGWICTSCRDEMAKLDNEKPPVYVTTGVRVYEVIDTALDQSQRVVLYCEDIVSACRGWHHLATLRVIEHETMLLDMQGYVIADTDMFSDCDASESYRRYCEMEETF